MPYCGVIFAQIKRANAGCPVKLEKFGIIFQKIRFGFSFREKSVQIDSFFSRTETYKIIRNSFVVNF